MSILQRFANFFRREPDTIRDAYEAGCEAARRDKAASKESRKAERLWDTPARPVSPTTDTETASQPQEPITAKVAKVLSEHHLVLNIGKADGAVRNMCFNVYVLDDDNGEVLDPDTGESLGTVGFPHQPVKILEVREKFSIAVSYQLHPEYKYLQAYGRSLFPAEKLLVTLSSNIKIGSHAQSIN